MKLTKKIIDFLKPDTIVSEYCVKAQISRSTFNRRMKNPQNFTALEIKILKEMFNLKEEQIFENDITPKKECKIKRRSSGSIKSKG